MIETEEVELDAKTYLLLRMFVMRLYRTGIRFDY
jgi:hypothetical protein